MKYKYPPEFESLTPEQMKQVHAWLDEFAYRAVQEKLLETFGIRISLNKLCRYNQTRELAEEVSNDAAELGAREIYDMLNAKPVPFEQATLHIIERRTFEHALRRDLTVSKLVALHKLATYKTRLSYDQRRLAVSEKRLGIKNIRINELTSPAASEPLHEEEEDPTPAPSNATPSAPVPSLEPTARQEPVSPAPPRPVLTPVVPNKPAPAPMTPKEWTTILDAASGPQPATSKTHNYSPVPSAPDRVLASQSVALGSTWQKALDPRPPVVLPRPCILAPLMKEVPEPPLHFPAVCSPLFPLAA